MSLPAAAYPIAGVTMPTWIIAFDRSGTCTSPETRTALLAVLAGAERPTRLIFMSHGWNTDFGDAIGQYQAFLTAFEQVMKQHPPPAGCKLLFVGVSWPSVWFPINAGPGLAAVSDETTARANVAHAMGEDLGDAASGQRLAELLGKDQLTSEEADEVVFIALPALHDQSYAELPGQTPLLTAQDVLTAAAEIQRSMSPAPDLGTTGTFNPGRPAAPRVAGVAEYLDPRNLARLFSLYRMKDRAGLVGSSGVADLLRDILDTGVPVHLVGHSFGAKIMLSALCALRPPKRPATSALLLQPAISHLAFAARLPDGKSSGGYVAALQTDHVIQPIFCTYSQSDFPLHDVFHLAMRRAADLGDARIAAADQPPSNYAALGGYGPRAAGELLVSPIQHPGSLYHLDPMHRIVGLDGSPPGDFPSPTHAARIACHGCVASPYTAWALHQQMF